jgi:hypothetical protein
MNELNDPELERLLRRFQPTDPPSGLRARIVLVPTSQPVWPWAAAAAALLASAMTFKMATEREAGRIDLGRDHSAVQVGELTAVLGGDAEARELAESIVIEAQLRAELAVPFREPEGEQP